MSELPVKITPVEGLIALFSGLRDGSFGREDFIAVADASVDSGVLEPFEEAAWGAAYDALVPLIKRVDLDKIRLFERRTPEELRADADVADAEGKPGKASRLRARAARRES